MHKTPLHVAGSIFALVVLLHIYRLYSHLNIVVGTTEIPDWVNWVVIVVFGGLSYWMFSSACSKCDES